MKTAIASKIDSIDGDIFENAGRAPYYLIFDEKKLVKSIKNPFASASGGAGLSIAQMLFNEKIDLVVCRQFGDKMKNALKEKNIKFSEVGSGMSIKKIVEE